MFKICDDSWKNGRNYIKNKKVNENLIHEINHKLHGTTDLIMQAIASNINSPGVYVG